MRSEVKNESKLIKKIQKHYDRQAANVLISAYYEEIYAFMYKQLRDVNQAMDLTQEIFIAMLQSIGSYTPKKASFRTWLYRIASNKIIDYFRSSDYKYLLKSTDLESIEFLLSDTADVEVIAEDRKLLQDVLYQISLYDFEVQEILRLKFFADKTFSEIAQILMMSENTVKTKYYTALKRLRKDCGNR